MLQTEMESGLVTIEKRPYNPFDWTERGERGRRRLSKENVLFSLEIYVYLDQDSGGNNVTKLRRIT